MKSCHMGMNWPSSPNRTMLYTMMRKEPHHLLIKIYPSLFFLKSKLLWCVRNRERDRLLYWPITSSLDYTTLCYLQDPTWHFCFSTRVLNQRPTWPPLPAEYSLWLQAGSDSGPHWLILISRHLHISFHNTYKFW